MSEFKKYNSIENTYNKDFLEKIEKEGYESLVYVVQEKVHGANCCFMTDGTYVNFAKRTGPILPNEKFYNYEELLSGYKEKVLFLFSLIKAHHPSTNNIMVYGEMFGGNYPHPEVKNDSRVMCIQKGVFYSPTHEFYGFDIYIGGTETNRYLSVYESNNLFEKCGFFFAKTLFEGTIRECLTYPNTFQSRISEWLGLPPIENNICEGIVIRPAVPIFLNNGSRLLLKNKNAKFAEKKSVKKRQPALFVEPGYTLDLLNQLLIAEGFVTENRLHNVISKIGDVSFPKDAGKLIGLLSKDVLEDYLKEHSGSYAGLEKSEQKIFNRHLNKLSVDLIKKLYMSS
jgi:Rnl2 family RNA ligase